MPKPLSPVQRQTYLDLLLRGATPAKACDTLGVTSEALDATCAIDPEFAVRLSEVSAQLSQNVAAALYRQAMEGSVPAQTFLLKNAPPPEWPRPASGGSTDELEDLTDDELAARLDQEERLYATATPSRTEPPPRAAGPR